MGYQVESVVLVGAGLGAVAATEVEAATGSEALGKATGFIIDFLNPANDIQEVTEFLGEVGDDVIELVYEVDLEEDVEDESEVE